MSKHRVTALAIAAMMALAMAPGLAFGAQPSAEPPANGPAPAGESPANGQALVGESAAGAARQVGESAAGTTQQTTIRTATAKPMDLSFTYSAYMTNGKSGFAYKAYTDPTSYYGVLPVIYKARIKGSTLRLSGAYSKSGSSNRIVYHVKNKAFKLSGKAKYYRHTGNNNFYEKWNKAKVKHYLANKSTEAGGDIYFTIKNGKVTALSVQ